MSVLVNKRENVSRNIIIIYVVPRRIGRDKKPKYLHKSPVVEGETSVSIYINQSEWLLIDSH
jgi:hypothetical protein